MGADRGWGALFLECLRRVGAVSAHDRERGGAQIMTGEGEG